MSRAVAYASPSPAARRRAKKVPDHLVREVIDGIPFYYKGYKNVLAGRQTFEEIMGSSGLQSILVGFIHLALAALLDRKKYWLFVSEPGSHLDHNNNLSSDVAVFDRAAVKPADITVHYLPFAPKIAIEVDVRVDTSEYPEHEYIYRKTSNLFRFGTEKVIWIFPRTQQVVIAAAADRWTTVSWSEDIEVLDGATFNIAQYLAEEGIDLETALK